MDGEINEVSEPDLADGSGYVSQFLGGSRRAHPDAWAAADPFALAKRYPARAHAIPFLLIHGLSDTTVLPEVSKSFQAALVAAGYHSRLVLIPDADHIQTLSNRDVVVALMTFMTGK